MADRRLGELPLTGGLKRCADTLLDVLDALPIVATDARRSERDPPLGEVDAPALLVKVRDQQADGAQLDAVAVVHEAPRQRAELFGEARRRAGSEIEDVLEAVALTRREIR